MMNTAYDGHCWVCGTYSKFVRNNRSIREGFRCRKCKASLRYRGQAQALIEHYGTTQTHSLDDLVSLPTFKCLDIYEAGITGPFRERFGKLEGYQCSFYWDDVEPGVLREGIQCQNLEELTFDSSSFDLIVSSDIMEHVRKPWKAFEEIYRVLKPGGVYLFSIPVQKPVRSTCIYRVDTSTDTDNFLLEPRYHGNGIGGRSLVYIDYGWDLMDKLSSMGYTVSVHSPDDDSVDAQKLVTFICRNNAATRQRARTHFDKACNVCGGVIFIRGPLGRMASNGRAPKCQECGSLERHRILRSVWDVLRGAMLKEMHALQFSREPSVDSNWFGNFEESLYGSTNSIDIQEIDRPDESYDVIICNQILEHVEKDKTAFRELIRILKPNGFLQLTVPRPIVQQITDDWGYPKTDFHGHYRHYGLDFIDVFSDICPKTSMTYIRGEDNISKTQDFVFFWSKSANTIKQLRHKLESEFEVMD
jgi:ubiquinone/menaquinone biosynthesis C-methylase UbiE